MREHLEIETFGTAGIHSETYAREYGIAYLSALEGRDMIVRPGPLVAVYEQAYVDVDSSLSHANERLLEAGEIIPETIGGRVLLAAAQNQSPDRRIGSRERVALAAVGLAGLVSIGVLATMLGPNTLITAGKSGSQEVILEGVNSEGQPNDGIFTLVLPSGETIIIGSNGKNWQRVLVPTGRYPVITSDGYPLGAGEENTDRTVVTVPRQSTDPTIIVEVPDEAW